MRQLGAWHNVQSLESLGYTCGRCGREVASARGYQADGTGGCEAGAILICPHCGGPTLFTGREQIPGPAFGESVASIPDRGVETLYEEARKCIAAGAFTAAVLLCRKLLMNIAVAEGARHNLSFAEYVDYLVGEGHVPPKAKGWVDHIRDKGNDANHEIALMSRDAAEQLVEFMQMVLKMMYDYPARIPKTHPPQTP